MKTAIYILLFIFLPLQPVHRASAEASYPRVEEMFDRPCLEMNVPKALAMAIAQVESGFWPWVLNVEGRGFRFDDKAAALAKAQEAGEAGRSFDIGLMQVNNWWLDRYNLSLEEALDPLANIYLGCWILKNEIVRHSTLREAIGAYHSPDPAKADRYASQVLAALNAGPKPAAKNGHQKPKDSTGQPTKPARPSGQTAPAPSDISAPMTVFSGGSRAATSQRAGDSNNSLKVSVSNGKK
jgi:hypothetical protein